MIEVKVFGSEPPCVKCKQAEQEARKAAAKFPGQVSVEKLSALLPEALQLRASDDARRWSSTAR